jgi:hypothetical protein
MVSYFGVRRQSEAATALWFHISAANPKRCRATLATALQSKPLPEDAKHLASLHLVSYNLDKYWRSGSRRILKKPFNDHGAAPSQERNQENA